MRKNSRREIWKESLVMMRTSLISSYDLRTNAEEEKRLIAGWKSTDMEYMVFSDYLRNEGRRRLQDITEAIDAAISEIDHLEGVDASIVYLNALKTIALYTKWRRILEESNNIFHNKPGFPSS